MLAYLHSQNVYFGNVNPSSLLLFRNYKLKVRDFSYAIRFDTKKEDVGNRETY